MAMDRSLLDRALRTLGETLEARGLAYELVVIGGSSLMLLGFITRPTKDLDAVALMGRRKVRAGRTAPATAR